MHPKPEGGEANGAAAEAGSPRSGNFRQRSMHAAPADPEAARRAFDVENPPPCSAAAGGGLRPSESVTKLESLERAERAALAPAVVLRTGFYILVWYAFSTCLTLYNKTLLGDKLGKFPAPLLMNTVHFALQAGLSKLIIFLQSKGPEAAVEMGWKDYFIRVVPTALGTALDINLSNASLVFISVTFATMCKSASPIFLLLFAFAFRLENASIKLLGIIVVISTGVLLTVSKETEFDFLGFIFVTLAAVMSGFRWSMTQILLQKDTYGLKNPITLMSHVTPVMAIATMILSLLLDPWSEFKKNSYFDNPWHVMRSCLLMLIGGTLAFFMVLTEYILISATSAITVTIAGVVKESVTILVAVFYFHDEFTWLKGVGLFTIMVGVSLFNWYKYEKFKRGHIDEDDANSPSCTGDVKYIILDDLEYQDEFEEEDT
ncbi:probable sugar phosphate/phosphate translocator At1g06470 [Zea mays]|uniref:Putative sugar phosphate/phosphate translocator n=1 Tax=Zea mays TaxID=4577 RepID=K7V6V0_MAIZE|nr:probable sugar phosphate/phosphate translocator At1g06470 [Zea mays]AQL02037.1 putative sugar phosphate/phosphate translocator [Zea mays]|eukprot:XP_008659280.1 probable sugar phosphate/phosphate translocator At1g06470 [Zea mays]